jgi:hypothetical protein
MSPTIRDMQMGLEEDVNGTIIGDVTFPYEFWTVGQEFGQNCIDKGFFPGDDEAVEWFKDKYPEWFRRGVEMRVYP